MEEEIKHEKKDKRNSRTAQYFKKKKKKSFLQNARNFGKKGNFGRGSNLEKDDYDYLLSILQHINTGFEDTISKEIMANNVFEQVKGKEIQFATNQVACRVLESLVGFTSDENFEGFADALSPEFRVLCSDRFASFVLEKLLKISTMRALSENTNEESEDSDSSDEGPSAKKMKTSKCKSDLEYNMTKSFSPDHKIYCNKFLMKISRFLLNNLEDFLFDQFGNHVMRTCISCLAGLIIDAAPNNSKNLETTNLKEKYEKEIPGEWIEIVKEYVQRLKMWPQFPELPNDDLSSCILQTLCKASKNCVEENFLLDYLGKILQSFSAETQSSNNEEGEKSEETIPAVFQKDSTLYLIESMIQSSTPKFISELYEKFFKDNLVKLSETSNANFSVQKLIDCINDKKLFELIYDEIMPSMKELLQIGHTGVVLAMAHGCQRLSVKQGQYTQALLKALDCVGDSSSKCIIPILKLKPLKIVESEAETNLQLNLHGSMILQHILKFTKPIKFVQYLLDMKTTTLVLILCDPKGSFLADAYLGSKSIGEKSREKFIKKFEGIYLQLAASKHGSRVLDKLLEYSDNNQKETIIGELAERVNQLNGTQYGRILYSKYSVSLYAKNTNIWKAKYLKS